MLTKPSSEFSAVLAASSAPGFWSNEIVTQQQKVMITAAATAVGINMTFLLPYSMLRRGWDREFRGLAMFDLSTRSVPAVLPGHQLRGHRRGFPISCHAGTRIRTGRGGEGARSGTSQESGVGLHKTAR